MAMAGIVDDIVKGIKKFGDDVIEGAKNGPGKAARVKKGVTTLNSNGKTVNVEDYLNDTHRKRMKKIINKGRQDFDSLSDSMKNEFKIFNKYADSSGGIKNYADIVAAEADRIRKMSDEEIIKSGISRLDSLGFGSIGNRPNGMSDADWAKHTRDMIGTLIEPGEKTAGRIAGDFTGGGLYGSYSAYKNMAAGKKSIMGALKEGHSVVNDAGEKVISGKKVAGTAITVAAAGALGNRVFRDEYGELDVPVVPFI